MNKDEFILNFIEDSEQYYINGNEKIKLDSVYSLDITDIVFYKIDKITFEDKAPRKEALENVLSSMKIKGVNFLYLIKGDKNGVSFYYGIVRDLIQKYPLFFGIDKLGDMILKPGIESNFRGSKVTRVENIEQKNIINSIYNMNFVGSMNGVPGINDDDENYQGIDRMVDVMLGDEFAFLVIAKILPSHIINIFENKIYKFYDKLVPLSKNNIQTSENKNETIINTTSVGTSESSSNSNQSGTNRNFGISVQTTNSTTKTSSKSDSTTTGKSSSNGKSSNNGYSSSDGDTSSHGKSSSTGNSSSKGNSTTIGTSSTNGKSTTDNTKVYSTSDSKTTSSTKGKNENYSKGTNITKGESKNIGYESLNKSIQEWLKYIDDVILKRLDYGKGKGICLSNILLFTMEEANMLKLENTVTSLFSGKSGNKVPLRKVDLIKESDRCKFAKNFQIPIANFISEISEDEICVRTLLSQYATNKRTFLGNWFSVNELSIIAGLPQKEVVGLSLREEVEFGLNCNLKTFSEDMLPLGNLIQSGNILKVPVFLDKKELSKHIFITGVTGSGKTTTCQKLLIESDSPFLVIEPAKTEYRILTKKYNDILIFTPGKDKLAPFRLNPFEFYPHESITSHVDMIMASIEASFDMEAAIPQIIEKSIYECYTDYGWDISDDSNKYYSKNDIDNGAYAFPTLSDLIEKTEEVVKKQGFDIRLQSDYIGSIKARLQGLTIGSKGLMLNTRRSLDFRDLVHRKVILELEEIRSGSEKALIIGFVLSNLMEAIKAEYKQNTKFKHITLVEEAHRLLAKYEPGDSLTKKQGIEMFSNMLAEVRKYGESLIIVDQIPGKLTSDVLKNTNTKIVHKIFAQDDKEAIGNTMALTDEQKEFLSFLDKGRAVVFSQGWDSSLQVQISPETNTSSVEVINDDIIRDRAIEYYCKMFNKGIYPTLKYCDAIPKKELFIEHINHRCDFNNLLIEFQKLFKSYKLSQEFKDTILNLEGFLSIENQAKYIRDNIYFYDKKDEKLVAIISLLNDIKKENFDVKKYDVLSYGRRRVK